ncbi:MAG: hypothetical protein LIP00_00810 [Parabacteroides sp.]|nr:hypothetical protein [Parabacteroides sp.]
MIYLILITLAAVILYPRCDALFEDGWVSGNGFSGGAVSGRQSVYPGLVSDEQESQVTDVYPLKNGYELRISLSPDSMRVFTLKRGDKERVIETDPYYGDEREKFCIRYSGIDFDDYFVLDRWESQYSVYLYLYEKSSGKNLFTDKQYLESGCDASANFLLYLDTDNQTNPEGNLTLLNLQNLTTVEIDVRRFIPREVLPNYYWEDFRVNKAGDKSVRITYDGEKQQSIDFPVLSGPARKH